MKSTCVFPIILMLSCAGGCNRESPPLIATPEEAAFGGGEANLRWKKYDEAIQHFEEFIRLKPNHPHGFLGRGRGWSGKGEYDRAIKDFDEAIRLDPNLFMAFDDRGQAWFNKGEYDRTIKDFDEAIRLDANPANSLNNRGQAWVKKGEFAKALKDFDESIRLDSKDAIVFDNRAWLRAGCPLDELRDGAKAVADATRACEMTGWRQPYFIATLAAAFAESEKFEQAVRWQKKALENDEYAKDGKARGKDRLTQFEAGKSILMPSK